MKSSELDAELLRKAIAAYLELAYPHDAAPPAELAALTGLEGLSARAHGGELLAWERFERQPAGADPAQARRFQLRLGNARYPHMKLSLDRLGEGEDWVLDVDTHDQHLPPETGSERLRAVQNYNEALKRRIEERWMDRGFDTARGRLRAFGRQGPAPARERNRGYALLVDDDPDILEVERILLEGEGFTVLLAQEVGEALSKAQACGSPLSLAIIDIMIPGQSGYALLEKLRECKLLRGPALFVTAMMDGQIRQGLADAVVHKPFRAEELQGSIRQALAGRG